MSRITVTIYKCGLGLEADLSRLTREIQKKEKLGYKSASSEAERRLDRVHYTQVLSTDYEDINLQLLGEHIAKGAPFTIVRE